MLANGTSLVYTQTLLFCSAGCIASPAHGVLHHWSQDAIYTSSAAEIKVGLGMRLLMVHFQCILCVINGNAHGEQVVYKPLRVLLESS